MFIKPRPAAILPESPAASKKRDIPVEIYIPKGIHSKPVGSSPDEQVNSTKQNKSDS